MHLRLSRIVSLALPAALVACSGDGPTPPPPGPVVATVTVMAPAPMMVIGSSAPFIAIARTASGTGVAGRTPQWQSSNPGVATVSSAGLVTAVASGTTRITATVDGVQGGVDLGVRAPVASVRVTPNPAEVAPGATVKLTATALDAAGAPITLGPGDMVWTSADNSIATVDGGGTVQGVRGGTVEIRATAESVPGTASVRVVVPVPNGLRFSTVTAGSLHACALDGAGQAWCWGINQGGQLGTGASDVCAPNGGTGVACSRYPVAVGGPTRFTAISAGTDGGGEATCAVSTAGALWCWGGGAYGQNGSGLKANVLTPAHVLTPTGVTFTTVVLGGRFACALATDGTAWCWGDNFYGTLGNGTPFADVSTTPVPVATDQRFVSLAAGGVTACGLTAAGKAYCWGVVDASQQQARAPVAMAPAHTFVQIAAGGSISSDVHVCGLQADGKVFCWGYNTAGQLGIPTGTTTSYNNPVPAMGGLEYTALSAGAGYTCGMQAGGAVRCAGRNSNGELGTGSTGVSAEPRLVDGPAMRALSTGWFSCGIGTDALAYCWGRNDYGQLGTSQGTTCQSQPGVPTIPCALLPVRVRGQD